MMRPEERMAAVRVGGKKQKFVLFWGHRPRRGYLGVECFSQWWPAPTVVDAVRYPTAEHWMMAEKARLFADPEGLARVLAASSPPAAKAAGRQVRGFDEKLWAARRYDIVVAGNLAKFSRHPDLAETLRRTGAKVLVEAKPVDRVWGIGLAATDEAALNPGRWRGQNLLGFALMDVRDALRADG